MSLEATIWAWEQVPDLESRAKLVLLSLADHVRPDTRTCWPSQERLARLTGLSVSTVRRAIGDLERKQLIRRRPRMRPAGRGRRSDEFELYGPAFCGDQPVTGARLVEDSPSSTNRSSRVDQPVKNGDQPVTGGGESLSEAPTEPPRQPPGRTGRRSGQRPHRRGLRKLTFPTGGAR